LGADIEVGLVVFDVDVDVDVEVDDDVPDGVDSLPHPTTPTVTAMAAMPTLLASACAVSRGLQVASGAANPRRIKPSGRVGYDPLRRIHGGRNAL
jgi:hypothetical protein